ncbi:hypothetical protein [Halorarius litoreus]|uniref:hypothetical protein n=1 Tax=Halorarius litoreus TaxID=2962676 RepID=UPI0020CCEAF4|nr:hypothetical protein [Halorarius litoreus]
MSTRRSLLRAAGVAGVVALAGCTAIANDDSDPLPDGGSDGDGPGGSQPSDLEHPPDATHIARITGQDDAPDLPIRPRVSLADPYVTQGSPPVVRVDVENPTDDPVVVGEYRGVVFQYVGSDDRTYVFLPHSERSTEGDPDRTRPEYDVEGDGCWRLTSGIAVTQEYGTVEVPANGTLTAYVGLYASEDAGRCTPLGERRFETVYNYFEDGVPGGEDTTRNDRWGFSLSVEEL